MPAAHLPPGTQLRVVGADIPCTIDRLLGEGGQGAVYAATVGSSVYALKWYFPHVGTDPTLRRRIATMIVHGSPDRRFLWPVQEVTDHSGRDFGYLMPVAPQGHRPLVDLFSPSSATRLALDLRQRAHVALEIADCFQRLHAGGFCYQDINFGSFLVEPASLSVFVCDNDNVEVDGQQPAAIGTLHFMAPELVRGEAMPSANTDLFSLGVLIFYLLTGGHPLLGRAESEIDFPDAIDWQRLLGTEPRFIFDPHDRRNAAVPGVHDRQIAIWQTLTADLRALFVRAFGVGLDQPRRRVLETEWRSVLALVRDTAVTCGCPTRFDTVASAGATTLEPECRCALCGADLPSSPRLTIGEARLVVTAGARLLASHVARDVPPGRDRVIGEAASSPSGLRGLRNVGTAPWHAVDEQGRAAPVPPGRALTLRPGMRIDFGTATGVVA
jgi:DNA-binding helix-hairpin-helix protein with protein kinase domain